MRVAAVPGLKVSLTVDGEDLAEYDDEEHPDFGSKSRTRYVEAVSGSNFTITVCSDRQFAYEKCTADCAVYLDGKQVQARVMNSKGVLGQWSYRPEGLSTTTKDQRSVLERFKFDSIDFSDENIKGSSQAGLLNRYARLGEIELRFTRCRMTGHLNPGDSNQRSAAREQTVPEKALKGRAISQRASFGAPVPHAPVDYVNVDYPWGKDPFATFVFRYRSRQNLQIEGIIPRDPTPLPLEERDPDTLTAEEARELVRRQRAQLQDMANVKREKRDRAATVISDDKGDDVEEVKQEGSRARKRHRASRDADVEVIDLS